jgi:hypothetical protein
VGTLIVTPSGKVWVNVLAFMRSPTPPARSRLLTWRVEEGRLLVAVGDLVDLVDHVLAAERADRLACFVLGDAAPRRHELAGERDRLSGVEPPAATTTGRGVLGASSAGLNRSHRTAALGLGNDPQPSPTTAPPIAPTISVRQRETMCARALRRSGNAAPRCRSSPRDLNRSRSSLPRSSSGCQAASVPRFASTTRSRRRRSRRRPDPRHASRR